MAHNFQVGDVVRVTKIVMEEEGWENCWAPSMSALVGHTCKIEGIYKGGIELFMPTYDLDDATFEALDAACEHWYPPSCFELIQAVSE